MINMQGCVLYKVLFFFLIKFYFIFMSQFFTSGGQSIGVSASTSVLPMNPQD